MSHVRSHAFFRVVHALTLIALIAAPLMAAGGSWVEQGPGPLTFGQVENVPPTDDVSGAVHTVAAHPIDPDTLYIGAVNGGVWKTTDATSGFPTWTPLTEKEASNSIGALEFDPTDDGHKTLVAGIGLFSSFGRIGGARTGLLRTTNAGNNWKAIDGGGVLIDKNIAGVAPRGKTLVVAIDFAVPFTFGNIGIWRSTDGGNTFNQIAVGDGSATGLPGGVTNDLVGDPTDGDRLFTSVVFADFVGGANGVYRSDDTGATWTKVSSPAIDALLISGITNNVEMAVGNADNVYVSVVNGGRQAGLFRSGDGGATWTALDVPVVLEEGFPIGIHPGGQGSIHHSIVADPTDDQIVYVGGDRQPFAGEASGSANFFPNAIGAFNFSGRLFRVDASKPPGTQAEHLTNSNSAGPAGGGTASNSSPHADSREMVFDAAGVLIETDDGGIYRRTSPRTNAGDWFSLNGNLRSNEQHDGTFDALSLVAFSGNQDTASGIQDTPGSIPWTTLLSGDGADTGVDNTSSATFSTRFTSAQFLQGFLRTFWDASNNFLGFVFPSLVPIGTSNPITGQFVTPTEVNAVDGQRIVIGGGNSVYESFDQGDTIDEIGPGIQANGNGRDAISYGHPANPDILYVGAGTSIFVRTGPPPAPLVQRPSFPGTPLIFTVRDIVIDPASPNVAYVITTVSVFQTTDAGVTWSDVTGDLLSSGALTPLRSIEFMEQVLDGKDVLVIGSSSGTHFAKENQGFTKWKTLGNKLPKVPVFDLDYEPATNTLTAHTLGRAAWKMQPFED